MSRSSFALLPRIVQRFARRAIRFCIALAFLAAPIQVAVAEEETTAESAEIAARDVEFFENQIRPILIRRCYKCHSTEADEVAGELRLDHRPGWQVGGYRGPAIVPGKPSESLLIEAVSYSDSELQMPPDTKLPAQEIAALRRWVEIGAPDPRLGDEQHASPADKGIDVAARRAEHWAWKLPEPVEPPQVRDASWPLDAIDHFVLARLDEAGLKPASDATRATWLRRVTFALRGMPPTPAELQAFLADQRPDARLRVVDRLLAASEFGETWGQHWLDLVRYAETKGHEQDFPIPHAWRYRDYVIRALNANVPYDQFVVEHVAGDLLDPPRIDPETRTNQSIQATGFWFLGEATHSPVDIRGEEADRVANQLDVFGKSILGLTMGCTRCHDHKFDAITAADYYALFGFYQSSGFQVADVSDPEAQRAAYQSLMELNTETAPVLAAAYAKATKPRLEGLSQRLVAAVHRAAEISDDERLAANSGEEGSDIPMSEAVVDGGGADESAGADTQPRQAEQDDRDEPLEQLAAEILAAAKDPSHVLHVLGATAQQLSQTVGDGAGAGSDAILEPSDVSSVVSSVTSQWDRLTTLAAQHRAAREVAVTTIGESGEKQVERRAFDPERDRVINYSVSSPEDWYTSGWRMGPGPAQAGSVLLGARAKNPLVRVLPHTAATGDMTSPRMTGLLRTPTFEIVGDTLWYRYRGKADVFLAVDSHRTVHGPLHGVTKKRVDSPDKTVWFGCAVTDYIGHRVHLEFTPRGPFELYEVCFGSDMPPVDFAANGLLAESLASLPERSLGGLVQAHAQSFSSALDQLASGAAGAEISPDAAELVNWLLSHDELLSASSTFDEVADQRFSELARTYVRKCDAIERGIPKPVWAPAMLDGNGEDEPVHVRGNHRRLAAEATPRRFLEAIDGEAPMQVSRGSGRMQLAARLVAADNPLTARVFVNRVWHHLFGRGIVPTVDDFGAMGEPPSHPELLDFLAIEFVDSGWDVKQLIRRITLSRTYRMSSRQDPAAMEADPTNRLLHRRTVRRLTGEQIRDSVLAVSGGLRSDMYGKSVPIHITEFMRHNRSPKGSGPEDGDGRRSIYLEVRRNHLSHFLTAFDRPIPSMTIGRRNVSNSAAQPLILLNAPFVYNQALAWAERLLKEHGNDSEAVLEAAYLEAFCRRPTDEEQAAVEEFLSETRGENADADQPAVAAWSEICHTLFNAKEFIFLR